MKRRRERGQDKEQGWRSTERVQGAVPSRRLLSLRRVSLAQQDILPQVLLRIVTCQGASRLHDRLHDQLHVAVPPGQRRNKAASTHENHTSMAHTVMQPPPSPSSPLSFPLASLHGLLFGLLFPILPPSSRLPPMPRAGPPRHGPPPFRHLRLWALFAFPRFRRLSSGWCAGSAYSHPPVLLPVLLPVLSPPSPHETKTTTKARQTADARRIGEHEKGAGPRTRQERRKRE